MQQEVVDHHLNSYSPWPNLMMHHPTEDSVREGVASHQMIHAAAVVVLEGAA